MTEEEIRDHAFAMPMLNPAYPLPLFRFIAAPHARLRDAALATGSIGCKYREIDTSFNHRR